MRKISSNWMSVLLDVFGYVIRWWNDFLTMFRNQNSKIWTNTSLHFELIYLGFQFQDLEMGFPHTPQSYQGIYLAGFIGIPLSSICSLCIVSVCLIKVNLVQFSFALLFQLPSLSIKEIWMKYRHGSYIKKWVCLWWCSKGETRSLYRDYFIIMCKWDHE